MKSFRTWIIISIISVLAIGGCKSFDPVEIGEPQDLRVASFSGKELNLEIFVPIKNPNLYRINVTKITATAYINGSKAGRIINREKIKLPSNSDKVHKLELGVNFSDLLTSGLSVMEIMREGKVRVSIKGTLTAQSFLYKKEIPFERERTLMLNN